MRISDTTLISYSKKKDFNQFKHSGVAEEIISQYESEFGIGNNVPIASVVTSHARMIINDYKLKALELGHELYYSDTDSLMISGPLLNEDISSTVLGKMKLEHKFKEGYFLMPKVYYLDCETEEVVKCKGYPGELTKEDYKSLYDGGVLNLKVTKWFKDREAGKIYIKSGLPYKLKVSFNKREQVLDSNNKWIGTVPLKLNDS
jgi:hypothetical protein